MPKFQPSINSDHFSVFFDSNSNELRIREDDEIVQKLQSINQANDLDFNIWDGNFNSAL